LYNWALNIKSYFNNYGKLSLTKFSLATQAQVQAQSQTQMQAIDDSSENKI